MNVIFAGIINWLITTIFVESTLFAPWRAWVSGHSLRVCFGEDCYKTGDDIEVEPDLVGSATLQHHGPWVKVAQLVTCHMCLGTWVGFAEAAYFGGPFHGWAAIIANGLLYKGIGHLVLELRPQAWVQLLKARSVPATGDGESQPTF